jgi:ribosomal-protein-alanine N-acetyltransferase
MGFTESVICVKRGLHLGSNNSDVILKTKRLELHSIRAENAQKHLDFHIRNREHFRKWGPRFPFGFFAIEFWNNAFSHYINRDDTFRFHLFKDELIIGEISLNNIVKGNFNSAHLGYKIDFDYQGLGLMTEALTCAINYYFSELKLHRLEASYMPHNFASANILKKLGFERVGLAKKYLLINGRYEDHIMTQLISRNS